MRVILNIVIVKVLVYHDKRSKIRTSSRFYTYQNKSKSNVQTVPRYVSQEVSMRVAMTLVFKMSAEYVSLSFNQSILPKVLDFTCRPHVPQTKDLCTLC